MNKTEWLKMIAFSALVGLALTYFVANFPIGVIEVVYQGY